MGRRYPGLNGFDGLSVDGATVSDPASGQILTTGAATRIATPWMPANGAEVTFAKNSTATGTLTARRSRGTKPPDTSGPAVIWTPPTPNILLDPAAGTLASQGWVGAVDSETYDPVDGTRRIIKVGAWGPSKNGAGLIAAPIRHMQYRVRFGLRANSSSGFYVDLAPPLSGALIRLAWLGSDYGASIGNFANGYGSTPAALYRATPGYIHDYDFIITTTDGSTANFWAETRFRVVGAIGSAPGYDFFSANGFKGIGGVSLASYGPNTYGFGQAYTSNLTDIHLGHVAVWGLATDESVTVTDGGTMPALANADWVQIEGPQASGVVSLLGVYTGTAPAAPASVTASGKAGEAGTLSAHVPTVAGTTAWIWTLKLAGTAVKVRWSDEPGITFTGLSDGDYTVEAQEQNAGGRLSAATASDPVTLPISATYTPPGLPPAPSPYSAPGHPAGPTWSEDDMNLEVEEGVAGSLSITHLVLGYQEEPVGFDKLALSEEAGFTSGEVAAGTVAYPGSFPTVIAEWEALIDQIRTLFPDAIVGVGYSDGQVVTWSAFINPVAQSEYECTVTGRVDEAWGVTGTDTVRFILDDVEDLGDQQYLSRPYEGIIQPNGSWQITGLPRGKTGTFVFADGKKRRRIIASGSTAAYGSLDPAATA